MTHHDAGCRRKASVGGRRRYVGPPGTVQVPQPRHGAFDSAAAAAWPRAVVRRGISANGSFGTRPGAIGRDRARQQVSEPAARLAHLGTLGRGDGRRRAVEPWRRPGRSRTDSDTITRIWARFRGRFFLTGNIHIYQLMLKIYGLFFLLLIDVGTIRGFVQLGNTLIRVHRTISTHENAFAGNHFSQASTSIRSILLLRAESSNTLTVDENVALEHRGVPSEHQGLHSALYGDGDDHGVSENSSADFVMNDVQVAVETFLKKSEDKKVSGVFAIIDANGSTIFIGLSRDLYASISGNETRPDRFEFHPFDAECFFHPKKACLRIADS